jgi:hypothetical protein
MAQDYTVNVKVTGVDQAKTQVDGLSNSLKDAGQQSSQLGVLDKITGGAVSGFKNATTGVKAFITGLKLTRAAIIATGIGALVVGVTALVGAFTSTRRGARQLQVIMAGLGAVVERVTAHFQAAGGFIADLFSKGPTEAAKAYRAEVDKLPGSMTDAVRATMELQKAEQALLDTRRELTVADAQGRQEIARLRLIARDRTKDTEERIDAAKRAMAIELDLVKQREEAAAEELRIAQERAKMSDTSDEDLQRLADLEANLINIRTQSFMTQRRLQEEVQSVEREATAERKAQETARTKSREAEAKAAQDAAAAIIKAEQSVVDELDKRSRESLDARTKEILAVEDFYNAQLDKAGDNAELIAQIETQRDTELAALREKFRQEDDAKAADDAKQKTDRERKVSQQLAAERMSAREQEKLALEERYNELAVDAEGNAELLEDIERRRLEARRALYEKFDDEDRARQQENNAKTLADVEAYEAKRAELMESARASTFSILSDLTTAFAKDTEEGQRKAFKRNKAISIAETLVSTYQAAQKAYASQLAVPTPDAPARATIAAGIAVAAGLANVAKIKSQQFTGGGSAGGGGGGGGGGIGGGTQSVGVDVGSLIPNQQTPTPEPVRAYIVESEISNKQALNRELQIQTTL